MKSSAARLEELRLRHGKELDGAKADRETYKSKAAELEGQLGRLAGENRRLESDNKKLADSAEILLARLEGKGDESGLRAELESAQAKADAYSDELRNKKLEWESERRRHGEAVSSFLRERSEARETIETLRDSLGIYRVLCRVRPQISGDKGRARAKIEYRPPSTLLLNNKEWNFNHVFTQDATSYEMFDTLWPVLNVMTRGRRVSLIAMGRTCSGKTHTITELLRMAVKKVLDGSRTYSHKVQAQFVEVYRKDKHLYDLGGDAKTMFQYNEADHGLLLDGCRSVGLKDGKDVEAWVRKIDGMRATAPTVENKASSRSHCLILITVTEEGAGEAPLQGALAVLDLAGDEDSGDNSPERAEESKFINSSLSHLRQFCTSRLENPNSSSRGQLLTSLFRRYSGERTVMLLNLSPLADDAPRAGGLLDFSSQVRSHALFPRATWAMLTANSCRSKPGLRWRPGPDSRAGRGRDARTTVFPVYFLPTCCSHRSIDRAYLETNWPLCLRGDLHRATLPTGPGARCPIGCPVLSKRPVPAQRRGHRLAGADGQQSPAPHDPFSLDRPGRR